MTRILLHHSIFIVRYSIFALSFALCLAGCAGDEGGAAKPAEPGAEPAAAASAPPPAAVAAVPGAPAMPGIASQTTQIKSKDLLNKLQFDINNPNFNKATGRDDPFAPLGESDVPANVIIQSMPERFRVCGVGKTMKGDMAVLEMGNEFRVVHTGDQLKNGFVVKRIEAKKVVLAQDKKEITIALRPSERTAEITPGQPSQVTAPGKLPNIGNIMDQYYKYLQEKQAGNVPGGEMFEDYLKGGSKKPSGEQKSPYGGAIRAF